MTDSKDIFSRLAHGDQEAFRTVFREFYPKVNSFVTRILQGGRDPEEVVQQIFIKIWLNREKLENVTDYDSYIFVLSKNTVVNHLNVRKRMEPVPEDRASCISDRSSPGDVIEMLDVKKKVDRIIEDMPPQRQLVFRMSRILGMKNEEISKRLNISKKTVENHINLALKAIRKALFITLF